MLNALRKIGIALVTVGYSLAALLAMPFDRHGRSYIVLARSWSRALLRIAGIRVHVHGRVPQAAAERRQSFVYTANHTSYFDIPVILAALDDDVRIIYKQELEKIPLFGFQLRKSPFIAVDRSDPRRGMQSMQQAVEVIRAGASVLVFPEGRRSEDGLTAEFKRGAFMLASRAGKAVVPVAIAGNHSVMPRGASTIRGGDVHVYIGDALPPLAAPDRAAEQSMMSTIHAYIDARVRSHLTDATPNDTSLQHNG